MGAEEAGSDRDGRGSLNSASDEEIELGVSRRLEGCGVRGSSTLGGRRSGRGRRDWGSLLHGDVGRSGGGLEVGDLNLGLGGADLTGEAEDVLLVLLGNVVGVLSGYSVEGLAGKSGQAESASFRFMTQGSAVCRPASLYKLQKVAASNLLQLLRLSATRMAYRMRRKTHRQALQLKRASSSTVSVTRSAIFSSKSSAVTGGRPATRRLAL